MSVPIQPDYLHDFTGLTCPYNYVKTKLALEDMAMGEIVEIVVDVGEPSEQVSKSIQKDGQTLIKTFQDENDSVHLLIQKTAE